MGMPNPQLEAFPIVTKRLSVMLRGRSESFVRCAVGRVYLIYHFEVFVKASGYFDLMLVELGRRFVVWSEEFEVQHLWGLSVSGLLLARAISYVTVACVYGYPVV